MTDELKMDFLQFLKEKRNKDYPDKNWVLANFPDRIPDSYFETVETLNLADLMLHKNQITKIENLENLKKLDSLSLGTNQIDREEYWDFENENPDINIT